MSRLSAPFFAFAAFLLSVLSAACFTSWNAVLLVTLVTAYVTVIYDETLMY